MKCYIFRFQRIKKIRWSQLLVSSIIITFILILIISIFYCHHQNKHHHIYLDTQLRLTDYDAWMILSRDTPVDSRRVKVGGVEWNVKHVINEQDINFTSQVQENILDIVKLGGKFIFLTSDNLVNLSTKRFRFSPISWQLYLVGELLNLFFKEGNTERYELRLWKTSSIQKIVHPGETIIISHGKTLTSFKFPISLDESSPPIVLPFKQRVLFNYNNIFFHYDVFWAIGVFHDLPFVWSVWTQRLLKEIDSQISLVFDNRVMNSNLSVQYRDEITKDMVSDVISWNCDNSADFLTCVQLLSRRMLTKGFISQEHYQNVISWIYRLAQIGYKAPSRIRKSSKGKSFEVAQQVLFYPVNKKLNLNTSFIEMCGFDLPPCLWNSTRIQTPNKPVYWRNILLVVVFNKVHHYDSVPYLDKLYRPFFANILYCGRHLSEFQRINDQLPVSFIEMHDDFKNGEAGYQCVQHAMHMNYDVDGYLHIGDDILLNIWNLRDLPTNQIWFQYKMRVANLSQITVPDVWRNDYWSVWSGYGGRIELINAMTRFHNLSVVSDIAQSFTKQLENNSNRSGQVFYEVSDIFYIPARYKDNFSFLVDIFNEEQVHLELAIPNIINGLDKQENIIRLTGEYLWFEDRQFYRESFDFSDVFLHPLKYDQCMKHSKCVNFLCQGYLPCLYGNN